MKVNDSWINEFDSLCQHVVVRQDTFHVGAYTNINHIKK